MTREQIHAKYLQGRRSSGLLILKQCASVHQKEKIESTRQSKKKSAHDEEGKMSNRVKWLEKLKIVSVVQKPWLDL